MSIKSTYFEDMHPRSFPKGKRQPEKNAALVPKPTLPGVSVIVERNITPKVAPRKCFLKWKQQHEALFKPVKFQTTNHPTGALNKRRPLPFQAISTAVGTEVESDFYRPLTTRPVNPIKQPEYQQNDFTKFTSSCSTNVAKPELQNMLAFSQRNRIARSEAMQMKGMKIAVHPDERQQSNQTNQDDYRYPTTDHPHCQTQHNVFESGQELNQQLMKPSKEIVKKTKGPFTDDTLVSIVEEQIEIVKQQKHILMQQNEIFTLQYNIEKLLLMNSDFENKLPHKLHKIAQICDKIATSPDAKQSSIQNGTSEIVSNNTKSRTSIGVMTSFRGNLKDVFSPNEMYNQKMAPGKDSHKDTMLERINKIIQKSPPMIDYRQNNHGNCHISPKRTDVSISTQTLIYKTSSRNNVSMNNPKIADRSFALHLLDMKYRPQKSTSPNTNQLNMHPRNDAIGKTKDLPIKAKNDGYSPKIPAPNAYDRPQASTPNTHRLNMHLRHDTIGKAKRSPTTARDDDFIPLNISPDEYDYLIRHGLLKK